MTDWPVSSLSWRIFKLSPTDSSSCSPKASVTEITPMLVPACELSNERPTRSSFTWELGPLMTRTPRAPRSRATIALNRRLE